MKVYKLKKLPVGGAANYADLGQLQRRLEALEALFNLLDMHFTEGDGRVLPPEAQNLFEEVAPETLLKP